MRRCAPRLEQRGETLLLRRHVREVTGVFDERVSVGGLSLLRRNVFAAECGDAALDLRHRGLDRVIDDVVDYTMRRERLLKSIPAGACAARPGFRRLLSGWWRRGRDSNPRYTFWAYTHFPGVRLQPLGHLSRCKPEPAGRVAQKSPRFQTRCGRIARDGAGW